MARAGKEKMWLNTLNEMLHNPAHQVRPRRV